MKPSCAPFSGRDQRQHRGDHPDADERDRRDREQQQRRAEVRVREAQAEEERDDREQRAVRSDAVEHGERAHAEQVHGARERGHERVLDRPLPALPGDGLREDLEHDPEVGPDDRADQQDRRLALDVERAAAGLDAVGDEDDRQRVGDRPDEERELPPAVALDQVGCCARPRRAGRWPAAERAWSRCASGRLLVVVLASSSARPVAARNASSSVRRAVAAAQRRRAPRARAGARGRGCRRGRPAPRPRPCRACTAASSCRASRADLADEVLDLALGARVEARRRLVEQQQRRRGQQRARERDLLLHARARGPPSARRRARPGSRRRARISGIAPRASRAAEAVEARRVGEVLGRRQALEERRLDRHAVDEPAHRALLARDVVAEHARAAAARRGAASTSTRTSVDLPEPFWPSTATHSPRASDERDPVERATRVRVRPLRRVNFLVRSTTSTACCTVCSSGTDDVNRARANRPRRCSAMAAGDSRSEEHRHRRYHRRTAGAIRRVRSRRRAGPGGAATRGPRRPRRPDRRRSCSP